MQVEVLRDNESEMELRANGKDYLLCFDFGESLGDVQVKENGTWRAASEDEWDEAEEALEVALKAQ